MVVFFHPTNGYFRSGCILGEGAVCEEDPHTGQILINMGSFRKGKLHSNAVRIVVDNDSFVKYEGTMVNGVLDGTVEIIEWEDLGPDPDIPEGNGVNNAHGKKHIYNSNMGSILSAVKREVQYNNGVPGIELSSVPQNVTLTVSRRLFREKYFFNEFVISEVQTTP